MSADVECSQEELSLKDQESMRLQKGEGKANLNVLINIMKPSDVRCTITHNEVSSAINHFHNPEFELSLATIFAFREAVKKIGKI